MFTVIKFRDKQYNNMKQCIINSVIHTGDEVLVEKNVIIENGLIQAITDEKPSGLHAIDLKGRNVAAGFIDIQVNGGEKFYFTQYPDENTLQDICDASLKYGVTHLLPCLISSSHQTILQAIEAVKKFMEKHSAVIGMHLEGPFINPLKRGAHVESLIRKPTNAELQEIIHVGKDVIKVMTVAPECFTDAQLAMLQENGIILSAGHSVINCKQAQYYFSKGITLVTHLYNAMTQFGHREPGLVGAVLQNDNVYAPVILDGQHCDYVAAQVAYKAKGDKLFLISDAAFLGRQVKAFNWGDFNMQLTEDGNYRNAEGNLAGASISMAEAVRNAKKHLNIPVAEAVKMATSRVAKAIRCQDSIGYLKPGYPSRLVSFDDALENIQSLVL
jgi:N-acetylglucosamine-6-phosphate deacetylase